MKITILDEINCMLSGFRDKDLAIIQENIRFREKGAHMTAAFKMDIWDGYTSMVDDEGYTYNFYLDKIVDIIENKTTIDPEVIELVDNRKKLPYFPEDLSTIPKDYLSIETGFPAFRTQQHTAIETALREKRGVLELATNFGKTVLCLALSKKLDPYLKTIIVTPSEQLARQTGEDYAKSDLSYCFLHSGLSKKKRVENIAKHRHIIITSKLFVNCIDMFNSEEYALVVDECHIFGDVFQEALRLNFNNAPMCWGITGSLPHDDKFKLNKIFATIGAGRLEYVSTKEITDSGYAAKATVRGVIFKHEEIEDFFDSIIDENEYDWSVEQSYYFKNPERMEAIADYLSTLPPKNTLILSHAVFGKMLATHMGVEYIDADTPPIERASMFDMFKTSDDHVQHASYGTSSTGISENRIFRLILIELGKDRKLLVQSVGRGIRLDGIVDELEVIDISSDTKFSKKHRADRIKIYKKEGHKLILPFDVIEIK